MIKELRIDHAERLDEVDLAILRSLASDGRKPIAQIAEEVGLRPLFFESKGTWHMPE